MAPTEPSGSAIVGDGSVVSESGNHWFEGIARHLGDAYLRYSFTKGTNQEIAYLVSALEIGEGASVLDVGCGPGRHALALAKRGVRVHGIDISAEFVALAQGTARAENLESLATFERLDARDLGRSMPESDFDAAICLCQGAFGLMTADGDDRRVLEGIRHRLRSGGRLALTAFNAYFAVKYHEMATFDADSGVSHEVTEIRNSKGDSVSVDLWTGCYTPRELRLLLGSSGFRVDNVFSVEPGAYGPAVASMETPEFLVLATAN